MNSERQKGLGKGDFRYIKIVPKSVFHSVKNKEYAYILLCTIMIRVTSVTKFWSSNFCSPIPKQVT